MSGVRNINMPYLALVRQADPDYDASRRHEHAYSFDSFGRTRAFYINPMKAGAYGDTRQFLLDEIGNPVLDEYGFPVLMDAGQTGIITESGAQVITEGGLNLVAD